MQLPPRDDARLPRSDHSFRRRRHAAVAAVARSGAQAVHAAARRRDAARQDRAARARLARRWRAWSRSPTATTSSTRGTSTPALGDQLAGRGSITCSSRSAATPRRPSPLRRCSPSPAAPADSVLLVLPADHLIRDQAAFAAAVARADGPCARRARSSRSASRPRIRRPASATSNAATPLPGGGAPAAFTRAALRREARARGGARVPHGRQLRVELGHVRVHAGGDPRARSSGMRRRCSRPAARSADALARRRAGGMQEIDAALFAAVPDISIDYAVMEPAARPARSRSCAARSTGATSARGRRSPTSPKPTARATAAAASAWSIDTRDTYVHARRPRGRHGRRRESRHRRHAATPCWSRIATTCSA